MSNFIAKSCVEKFELPSISKDPAMLWIWINSLPRAWNEENPFFASSFSSVSACDGHCRTLSSYPIVGIPREPTVSQTATA